MGLVPERQQRWQRRVAQARGLQADAGPVAASGPGWTCTGTTCTRGDALAPGDSYPPVKVTVKTANTAPASVTNAPTVAGGGDPDGSSASDVIPIVTDACPNGWAASEKVQFGPPVPAVDSGVLNLERTDGWITGIRLASAMLKKRTSPDNIFR